MVDDMNSEQGSGEQVSRRRFLRTAGATAAVGAGAVGATNSAAAISKGDGGLSGPDDFPRYSTRGHFDITWYGSVDQNEPWYVYDKWGDFSGYNQGNDLVIHAHGWLNDDQGAIDGSYTVDQALSQDGGYNEPVVGWSWDADLGTVPLSWWASTTIAEDNGPKLAYATYQFKQNNPNVNVRYVSHSLGARVVASAIKQLDDWGFTDYVESVTFLGGAVDNDAVALGGAYGYPLQRVVADQVDNYYIENDAVLDYAYSIGEADAAVGTTGVEGTPPANYNDHNVSYRVPDHYSHYYLKSNGGVMDLVAGDF